MSKADISITPIRSRRAVLAAIAVTAALPIASTAPAAASTTGAGAELVGLGKQLEILVDAYYVARRPWARAMCQYHSEIEERFGDPAERGYQDTDEIRAAKEEIDNRVGLDAASDHLSAAHERVELVAKAIEALPCTSIEGLRAKALVAFWEVAPLAADDAHFHFEDAYPFQQLFTAVAELCDLKGKMAATGHKLPFSDDDSGGEGEEA